MNKALKLSVAAIAAIGFASGANAALTLFSSFTGNGINVSTGGCGSTTQTCTLQTNVPAGATILAVYLYSSMFSSAAPGGTYAAGAVGPTSYAPMTALGFNGTLQAHRSVISNPAFNTAITGGATTVTLTETNSGQDGEAMVVVYSTGAADPVNTVFVFDGFSASSGDGFGFNIPAISATSTAEMRLGIGFSFDGTNCSGGTQTSTVDVNGTRITSNAGCNDDSQDATPSNGNLITVGGDNDPFSPFNPNPTIAQDHERYNLLTVLNQGDTSVNIRTRNPSNDDNIFLAVFKFSGQAQVCTDNCNTVPEPISLLLVGAGLLGLGFGRKKAPQV